MPRLKYIFALLALLLLGSALTAIHSQESTGKISGKVIDGLTKEPIIGANVVLEGTTLGASTDVEGRFMIRSVPVGTYSVRVSAIGYLAVTITDVVVNNAKPAQLSVSIIVNEIKIEGVEVTAGYFNKMPDAPLSTMSQSNEEIRRLPGGLEDVARAVAILPGVAQMDAGRNDLIVRGGAPSENLFVVDNIEVPNINHFGTQGSSGGPLSYINLDFVENTSFSTGGFGVKYGDKLSSVLSISLRDGRKDRLGGKATLSATQFGLNLEGPTTSSGSFVFSARRSYLDFIFKWAGFGFVPEYWDFMGKMNYALGPRDQLNILGVAALDNVKYFNDTEKQRFDNSRVMGSDQNQLVGGLSWQHLFEKGYSTVTLGQSYVDYNFQQNDSNLVRIFSNQSLEHESSLRGEVFFHASPPTEILLGILSKIVSVRSDILLQPLETRLGDSLAVNASYRAAAFKGALYGQLTQVWGRSRLTAGGRVDYFNLIHKVAFSLRVSYTVAVLPTSNLNWSIGRYYQAPSYIWLAANSQNRSLSFAGVDQFILGIDHLISVDTKVSVEAYYKNYFDYPASLTRPYLVLANTGAGFASSEDGFASFGLDPLASSGSGRARGVEFLVQKKLSEVPSYGAISVSYSMSDFAAVDGVERPSSFDQRWIMNLGGGYVFDSKWEMSAKFRYATGRPYTPFDSNGFQDPAFYNSSRTVGNHSLDVRVDRRWTFSTWTMVTYLDIKNIYNRKAINIPRYNPRLGHAEADIGSVGILPSLGVSAEF